MDDFKSLQKKALNSVSTVETQKYRTLLRRIGAGFIDNSIVLVAIIGVIFVLKATDVQGKYLLLLATTQFLLIVYNIFFIYFLGATPGKMLFGLKVVTNIDEGPVSLNNSTFREIINFVNLALYVYVIIQFSNQGILGASDGIHEKTFQSQLLDSIGTIVFLVMVSEIVTAIFNKKRRAIHDFVVDTIVVKKEITKKIFPVIGVVLSFLAVALYLQAYNYLLK